MREITMFRVELASTRYVGWRESADVVARTLGEASTKAVREARLEQHDRTIYACRASLVGCAKVR